MQADPSPSPAPGPIDVHLNLDALANLIWQAFIDHIGDVGAAAWSGIKGNLPDIGQAIWTPLSTWFTDGMRGSAEQTWRALFATLSVPLLVFQLPPALTYNLDAYRAVATDPLVVATAGATLALVLLGLRTLFGSMIGRDHVITHVTGRIIPATALAMAYPVLVAQFVGLVNSAGASVGPQALAGLLAFPPAPNPQLILPYLVLWLLLIVYAVRLLIRLAYSLFRFLVALVFGPVAIVLWAIPQTEWVTTLWLRELVGWGTTPLLVVVALAIAVPLAMGQSGFLPALLFSLAGLKAASDLVGLLGTTRGGGGGGFGFGSPIGYARMAAGAATGGPAGAAAATVPAMGAQQMADTYGFR
jgi:hypothetical protein